LNDIAGTVDKDNKPVIVGSKKIHFPFLTFGWGSKDEAMAAFNHLAAPAKDAANYHKVIFEVTNAHAVKFLDCRFVCHRLNGTIEKNEKTDDQVHSYTIAATHLPH